MNDWLIQSKDKFQDKIFDFLWRQWSILGVAGTAKPGDNRIIDPEALLLFSLSVCRYEPRLFDEIIDWLFQNGNFINVQRLQQIQLKYDFNCGPQLSAIAEILAEKASYRLKWSGLAKKYYQKDKEALFFDKEGNALPCPTDKNSNPEFLSHGLKRGQINLRGYSQAFDLQSPACLLLRLRALLGINARAEILCLLASGKEIHPSEAARITGYYQKTIQTTLVEMAQSGVILTRTSKKEKFYRLKAGVLDELLKPESESAQWINWAPLLRMVEILWKRLYELSGQEIDSLLLSSELKKLMLSVCQYCSDATIGEIMIDEKLPIEDFDKHFQKFLVLLSNRLFFKTG
ncbi:MAG: winged helix-turn-helix domain-containing protein [Phycisphaerae bacterium]|nr:winged helix-turn-helix domain-containing protein [Phycisphaerae bacterium]